MKVSLQRTRGCVGAIARMASPNSRPRKLMTALKKLPTWAGLGRGLGLGLGSGAASMAEGAARLDAPRRGSVSLSRTRTLTLTQALTLIRALTLTRALTPLPTALPRR